ncbi:MULTISPECIES: hypothetical protein [Bacillus]|uniref:hypothetical protein n=1 Tax=Bacillus TaxID=1386 RepID=UPI001C212B14|nr:hypothetical protein [Bacillus glycinifermentans]MBU8784994.1 hypothetical protein [Bacillus glycinifermentans]
MMFSPAMINLGAFKINSVDRGASVTVGPYQQIDYFLSAKLNYGFGEENGDLTQLIVPVGSVLDSDLIDSNAGKSSVV